MNIARILYPVQVLGPGRRIGIWFCGCPRRCKGCSNPELWEFQERYRTTPQVIGSLARKIASEHPVDGFTLSGGDPMYQQEELRQLVGLLQPISRDILVYTGYGRQELPTEALEGIGVLIDGPYIEERNTNCILRGSDNQTIHVLDPSLTDKYDEYCAAHVNEIQNFTSSQGIISVGIHKPGFRADFSRAVSTRGLHANG